MRPLLVRPFARAKQARLAILLVLIAVFIADDVLIYFLLKNLLNWKANPLAIAGGGTIVLFLNVSLAIVVYRTMRRKPTTGQEGMIGKTGVVLHKITGEGKVQVQGEIWRAKSAERLERGAKVVVEDLEGLRLIVRKAT